MHRTRTWEMVLPELRVRNRILPVSGGDGSTLSLDFTTGILDPRFTFSRSTTATFINSQGLVQYADHNLFTNTAWLGSTLPTNWNLLIGTGTITWNANGSVTMTAATSQRPAIYHSTITTLNPGVPHTFGYLATGVSGSPTISQIINSTIAGETYAINGVTVASSTVVQSNDVVSCTFTPTTTNVTARIGPGSTSPLSDMSVTASRPQFNVGSSLQPYAANTSTAATYQAPRFDYSPTTLAPRGLLIEGSATNLIYWSESFDTTGAAINWNWSSVNVTRGTVTTTAPNGASTTVVKIQETTATGLHAPLIVYSSLTSSVYTVSLFAKAVERQYLLLFDNGGSSANAMFNLSGNGTVVSESTAGIATITPYPNGWYRITMRTPTLTNINLQFRLSTDGTTTSYAGTLNSGVYIWGAQFEAGSGASSYIPTGASQVARAADQCFIANASPFQVSTTNGTLYWSGIIHKQSPAGYTEIVGFMDASVPTFEVYTNGLNVGVAARGALLNTGGANEVTRTYTLNAQTRYACSVNTTSNPIVAAVLNGGTVGTNTKTGTGNLYASTQFVLGRQPTSSYGTAVPCMTFAQVKYWPVTKTQAELNLLTTT